MLFNYSCLHFLPTLQSSQPNWPPSHTSTLLVPFVHVSLIVVPENPFPCYHLLTPLWLLLDCSKFQCLWLYFVSFFLLFIMFQLKVRSYGIYSTSSWLLLLSSSWSSSTHLYLEKNIFNKTNKRLNYIKYKEGFKKRKGII